LYESHGHLEQLSTYPSAADPVHFSPQPLQVVVAVAAKVTNTFGVDVHGWHIIVSANVAVTV